MSPKVEDDDATIVEAKSNEVRSIFDIHRSNEIFRKIANDPRVIARAEQLLGSEVYIHQSRINYKPGFVGKEFSWHSDFETWHAEDGMPEPRAVSLSLSLTDNYSFNRQLMIMPGSHQRYISCVGGTPEDNYKKSLVMQGAGTPDPQTLTDFADEYGIDVLEPSPVVRSCSIPTACTPRTETSRRIRGRTSSSSTTRWRTHVSNLSPHRSRGRNSPAARTSLPPVPDTDRPEQAVRTAWHQRPRI